MARKDKYKVGDKVEFIPVDEYGYGPVQHAHRAKYGNGPYEIEEIEETSLKIASHPQFVSINGETYSGFWFQPLR